MSPAFRTRREQEICAFFDSTLPPDERTQYNLVMLWRIAKVVAESEGSKVSIKQLTTIAMEVKCFKGRAALIDVIHNHHPSVLETAARSLVSHREVKRVLHALNWDIHPNKWSGSLMEALQSMQDHSDRGRLQKNLPNAEAPLRNRGRL